MQGYCHLSPVNDILCRYFEQYNTITPILSRKNPPNDHYEHSVYLFWAIIGVASRSYYQDPSLVSRLAPKINDLALLSLNPAGASLAKIKGHLLVLNWPFPKDSLTRDLPFPLAGGMLHMALQLGLHMPLYAQDFRRVKIRLSEQETARIAELWAYCVVIYQW
jgi:hypothetical protein